MGDSIPNAPRREAGGIPDFRHAAASLAKAALSLSEAAQAMSSAAEALSIAIPSAEDLQKYSCVCSNQSIILNETAVSQREATNHGLEEQTDPEHQAPDCEDLATETHSNGQEHNFPDDDYYMSDEDEDYINALLRRQQEEHVDRILSVTPSASTSTDYASCSAGVRLPDQLSAPPSVAPDSATDPTTQPSSPLNRKHILVQNEAEIFLIVSALSRRHDKVFCYMQYPLPSLGLYQKIMKDITKLFVFVMANWSSNSLPEVFDKQKRAIMLFHETFKIPPPPSGEANNFCIVHVGWPRNAERYLSQTACREAVQSVLIACSDEQSIYPSCSKILSSTTPWPDQDYKLLQTCAETLRPRLNVSLGSVLPEVKEKAYTDWIGAYGQGGQRFVVSWTPSTLVKRANIYALDTLQYGTQQPGPATGHVIQQSLPPVSVQLVKQNKLEPAVREGLLRVIPGSPGLDLMLGQLPSGGGTDKQQTTSLPSHKQESKVPSAATSQSLHPHLQRYLFHEDECDIVPLLCCLAKKMGQKNTICFVKVIFAWKALAPLISEVVSKPVFVVSTPKLSPEVISRIDQASESPTGCLVFCNILEPLTEQLRNETFSESIHIGWVDRGSQYQDQTRMSGLSSSFVILSKSDPPAAAPQEIGTESLWQHTSAPEDELIACYENWKEQLASAPMKQLRQCYMEWILYHHSGLHKVAEWSGVQLVTHANEFARNVLLHGDSQPAAPMLVGGTLSVTPGFVRQWGLQAAVDAKVLQVE
ncbi:hypothetical protein FRC12_021116 [Ceratobasidium sp. 428]|nr:hypothetical protein FRC12_021116 [Ceratobasidium sp. 428]